MRNPQSEELDDNITFESMLGELSAEMVNLSIETIDAAIESSLQKMVEFFDADRCHLGEFLVDEDKVVVPYFYSRGFKRSSNYYCWRRLFAFCLYPN